MNKSSDGPDFMIVGAMKSGTTSLHRALALHPDVFMCEPKEPQFFSSQFDKGFEWYRSLFSAAKPHQLRGEASTCYSRIREFPDALSRVKEHVGEIPLIFVLRDPVRRAISHYFHRMEERKVQGLDSLEFMQATQVYPDILDAGMYAEQIDAMRSLFGSDKVHIVEFEEFVLDPESVLTSMANYLGIRCEPLLQAEDRHDNSSGTIIRYNESRKLREKISNSTLAQLVKPLLPYPVRKILRDKFLSGWQALTSSGKGDVRRSLGEVTDADEQWTADYYSGLRIEVEQLVGVDGLHWPTRTRS